MNQNRPQRGRWREISLALLLTVALGCSPETPEESGPPVTAAPAAAAPAEAAGPANAAAATTTEQLWAAPPADWITTSAADTGTVRRATFEPENQPDDPAEAPREVLVFETLPMAPAMDPITFIDQLAAEQAERCDGFDDAPVFSGLENGYPTTVRLLTCGKRKAVGTTRVMLVKVIAGRDLMYVIAREKEGPFAPGTAAASADEVALWTLHLKTMSLCDPARPEHPCPEPAAAGGAAASREAAATVPAPDP